jgi:ABC-type glycerol-3-phosphate transport system permease component
MSETSRFLSTPKNTAKAPSIPSGETLNNLPGNIVIFVVLALGLITMLLPFIWMLSASFKLESRVLSYPPTLWPDPWTLENYRYVFEDLGYMRFVINSFIVVIFTISGHVISGSLVAFGFARMRFPGRNILFILVLSTLMIPFQAYMIPRFIIMRYLGLLDTLAAVFLPYLFGGAFYIFLMRQYFMSLPFELDDAARIDGCNSFQIYWLIAMPLAKPVIATVVVLEFLGAWTSFLEPLIYLNSQDNYTVALGLSLLRSGFGGQIAWGPMMAATALSALPPLIVFLLAQKQLIGGIAVTGIKG